MVVRDARAADEADWRGLWTGYTAFYGAAVPEAVTAGTWARILDPEAPVFARLAEADGAVVGFAVGVVHLGTWTLAPICYLEDLFVDPAHRGQGIGRRLIRDLVDLGRERGWSRLYWHTMKDNPARALYDAFAPADDFVRYRLFLD